MWEWLVSWLLLIISSNMTRIDHHWSMFRSKRKKINSMDFCFCCRERTSSKRINDVFSTWIDDEKRLLSVLIERGSSCLVLLRRFFGRLVWLVKMGAGDWFSFCTSSNFFGTLKYDVIESRVVLTFFLGGNGEEISRLESKERIRSKFDCWSYTLRHDGIRWISFER